MSVWLWTYVVTRALPSMYTSMGWGVYVIFATCLVLASIYAFVFIHETKGLRVDQMDELFGFERRHQVTAGAAGAKAFATDDHGETAKAEVVREEAV